MYFVYRLKATASGDRGGKRKRDKEMRGEDGYDEK